MNAPCAERGRIDGRVDDAQSPSRKRDKQVCVLLEERSQLIDVPVDEEDEHRTAMAFDTDRHGVREQLDGVPIEIDSQDGAASRGPRENSMRLSEHPALRTTALLAACLVAPIVAGGASAQTPPQLTISKVEMTDGDHRITITGTNLGAEAPAVKLGAAALSIVNNSETEIVADVPALTPGSCVLMVSRDAGKTDRGFGVSEADALFPIGRLISRARANAVVRMSRRDPEAMIRFVAGVLRIEPQCVLLSQFFGHPLRRRFHFTNGRRNDHGAACWFGEPLQRRHVHASGSSRHVDAERVEQHFTFAQRGLRLGRTFERAGGFEWIATAVAAG
ncbi:MAG: IPT/TIG domain-containing protein [Cyanobacteria bacterium]|nr:IPT/TIG domain-containing protein [Cyanobacteriota bacterium]